MASEVPIERASAARPLGAVIRRVSAAWLFVFFVASTWGQGKPSEYDVKAAYLLNFGKFLREANGKQGQHGDFNICILGRDPMGPILDEITTNEKIDGRPARVLRLNVASRARQCDVVFISPYEGDSIRADLAALAGAEVLTVSDAPDFLVRGGMIQFVIEQDHVRFEVNLDAVDRSHLVLSSELLRVAVAVQGRPPGAPR